MRTVKYGMEGYEVQLLQYALTRAGYNTGNLDGIFGRRTARALQQFQRDKGLAADGVAGKLTWAALYPYVTGYTLHRDGPETNITLLDMSVVTDSIPCSHLLTSLMLKGLTMRYPLLRVYETGRSVMGRPIIAVALGEGTKTVGYVGPHGADRWPEVFHMLRFAEERAAATVKGDMELYRAVTLHMIPLVNPDGVDLVTGALDPSDSFYAQAQALSANYPQVSFPEGWRANISGVDLNLQYPTGWEAARRIRYRQGFIRPGPRDYAGCEPLIAPESRAIEKWAREMDFDLVLSYDSGYTRWFEDTWGRPGIMLDTDTTDIHAALMNAPRSFP